MQLIRKTLAFGQLPSTKGDLYVPASGRKGFVHNITLHNTNTTDETVVLNFHDGTNEYVILNEVVPAGDSLYLDFRGEGEVVDDGAKITGNTTTAAKVTYKFSGTEEIPDGVAAAGGTGGRLIWEWNGEDITQFGDGAGNPDFTDNGAMSGTLAATAVSPASANQDFPQDKVLVYTHTGGINSPFFLINDLPTLPEHYVIQARLGPRDNGAGRMGENTSPGIILCAQDSTHHFRIHRTSAGTSLNLKGGNGDHGDVAQGVNQTLTAGVGNGDGGTLVTIDCVMGEPSSGVDPEMYVRTFAAGGDAEEKFFQDSGWSTTGGGVAPSSSWDSGWQTGGTIRRVGMVFLPLTSAGKGFIGALRIYRP